jgi:MFS family permease
LQIGAFFTIEPVFYISASILIQFIPKQVEKRLVIIVSAALTFIGFIFVGPSQVLSLPDSIYLIAVGQAITGATTAVMIIPGLSEMIDSQRGHRKGSLSEINHLAAGCYNAFLAFGQVLAPPYATMMREKFGFRLTVDMVAFACLGIAVAYFVFGDGIQAV